MALTTPTFQLSLHTSPNDDTRLLCGAVQVYCSGERLQKLDPLLSSAAHCASAGLLHVQAGFCVVNTMSSTMRARVAQEQLLASSTSTCSGSHYIVIMIGFVERAPRRMLAPHA
jgi:hypothetical protein